MKSQVAFLSKKNQKEGEKELKGGQKKKEPDNGDDPELKKTFGKVTIAKGAPKGGRDGQKKKHPTERSGSKNIGIRFNLSKEKQACKTGKFEGKEKIKHEKTAGDAAGSGQTTNRCGIQRADCEKV